MWPPWIKVKLCQIMVSWSERHNDYFMLIMSFLKRVLPYAWVKEIPYSIMRRRIGLQCRCIFANVAISLNCCRQWQYSNASLMVANHIRRSSAALSTNSQATAEVIGWWCEAISTPNGRFTTTKPNTLRFEVAYTLQKKQKLAHRKGKSNWESVSTCTPLQARQKSIFQTNHGFP